MLEFQQSETTQERRRWIITLVDAADGVTGLTGQTGQVYISKNGGTPALSTNSIVEVDATNMPGHYYIELTQGELDTLGFISITKKTAGSLAFHDRALVSYNDPYIQAGGFSGGGNTKVFGLTAKQMDELAKKVWEYKVKGDVTAKEAVTQEADPGITTDDVERVVAGVVSKNKVDLSGIEKQVAGIKIPAPADYTKQFTALSDQLKKLGVLKQLEVDKFAKLSDQFIKEITGAIEKTNSVSGEVERIKKVLADMEQALAQYGDTLKEQSDLDKRFEGMTSVMQKQSLDGLISEFKRFKKELLATIINQKYDILQELR